MYQRIAALILVGIFSWTNTVSAQMSSTNYIIRWDTVSTGGSDTSSSATYQLRDTIGNAGIGDSSSATYELVAGYRQGVFDQVITFDVFAQDQASGRAATASAGTTITADTTGLVVGDFIALIQNEGATQVSAIGRITSVGVGTLTVDELEDGGVAPVIDGTNDFVYELGTMTVDLGQLDPAAVNTAIIGFNVSADVDPGYVVFVGEDGNLRDGANDIDDVADGSVTAGSEEYGARSSDTTVAGSTYDTADTALRGFYTVSPGAQDIATDSTNVFERRNFLTLKASISASTDDGNYSHDLSFVLSGNY